MNTAVLNITRDPLTRTELLADALLPLLQPFDLTILPAGLGDELAVSLAAKTGGTALTSACSAEETPEGLLVRRKIYGGHIMGSFLLSKPPYFLSSDRNIAEPESVLVGSAGIPAVIEPAELPEFAGSSDVQSAPTAGDPLCGSDRRIEPVQTGEGLCDAKIVIAVGRGIRSKANIEYAEKLADALGAGLGGSRPVIMNAWLPKERLIGVSGEMVHPDLCLVLAASGSPAFYSGIEGSRTILAVNDSESAPIMKKADAYICADWKQVVSELLHFLKNP